MSTWSEGTWPGEDAVSGPSRCRATTTWGGDMYGCELDRGHTGHHEAVDGDMHWQDMHPVSAGPGVVYYSSDFDIKGPLAYDLLNMGGMLDRMNLPDPLEDHFKEGEGP